MMVSNFPKLNMLIAYPYFKQGIVDLFSQPSYADQVNLLVDSGAFTAWKAGKPIDLNTYMSFVRALPVKPYGYFMLDVIGDAQKTKENYERMLTAGLSPIPIFTRGESFDELENYYKQTDYIAIGGLVGTPGNDGFVKALMQKIGKRKVHLLGYAKENIIRHYKPYSVDSSSFTSGMRYASLKLYAGGGRWVSVNKTKMAKAKPDPFIFETLRQYDVDYHELSHSKNWTGTHSGDYALEVLAYRSYVRYSLELERALGIKYFLAVSSLGFAKQTVEAYNWVKQKYGGMYK